MKSPKHHRPGNSSEADQRLAQHARQLWHEAIQHIDPATAGRLRAARRQALQAKSTSHGVRWLIPTGALAMIALAALMVRPSLTIQHPATTVHTTIPAEIDVDDNELPPDADKADPNLYQNLDFYGWLAANNSHMAAH